jgi:hypothetical protein
MNDATTRSTIVSERVPWALCDELLTTIILPSLRTHPRIFHARLPHHDDQERVLPASRRRPHHQAPMGNSSRSARTVPPGRSTQVGGGVVRASRHDEKKRQHCQSSDSRSWDLAPEEPRHSAASAVGAREGGEKEASDSDGAAVTSCYRGAPPLASVSPNSRRYGEPTKIVAKSAEAVLTSYSYVVVRSTVHRRTTNVVLSVWPSPFTIPNNLQEASVAPVFVQ